MSLPLATAAPTPLLLALAALLGIGVAAQWAAWRLHLPSILLLLGFGFAAGPDRLGWIDPDALLGAHLLPLASVAVGIILFEGGLSLRLGEIREHGKVLWRLVTLGALVTWLLGALAAHLLLGLGAEMATLLGAVLVVSGPTVVGPLLHHIRPRGPAGALLKWEGIAIDPIGAVLALLVFGSFGAASLSAATPIALGGIWNTILAGSLFGFGSAAFLLLMLRHYWVPDALHVPLALTVVVLAFTGADAMYPESGLLAVTLLGATLANQRKVSIDHILEFKENLRVLLISTLFLLLAARLPTRDLAVLDGGAFAFLAVLILIVRPLAVWLCTLHSTLTWQERVFMAWLCPRGIVAAAVASVFALELQAGGVAGADSLVPVTFLVIVGTVVVYGLTAPLLARRLGLAVPNPQGVLLIGAHSWAVDLGWALKQAGVDVLLIDTNRTNVRAARARGLNAWAGNVGSERAREALDLAGIGRVIALTPNDGVNRLAMLRFTHDFGRKEVYRLQSGAGREDDAAQRRGRVVFGAGTTYSDLARRFGTGEALRGTTLTEQFDLGAFREQHGEDALVLFVIRPDGRVEVNNEDQPIEPKIGDTALALVQPAAALATEAPPRSAKPSPP